MEEEVNAKEKIMQQLRKIAGMPVVQKPQYTKTKFVSKQQAQPVPVAEGRVLGGIKQRINMKKILLISSAVLILIVLAFLVYYFFTSDFYKQRSFNPLEETGGDIPQQTDENFNPLDEEGTGAEATTGGVNEGFNPLEET